MPMYRFRIIDGQGRREQRIGFYRDEAAIRCARRMRSASTVEIWHEDKLVCRLRPAEERRDYSAGGVVETVRMAEANSASVKGLESRTTPSGLSPIASESA
jgi:hypothetical protein